MIRTKQMDRLAAGLQNYLRSLSKRRSNKIITADDAQTFLTKKGLKPIQVKTRLSIINSVLRKPNFYKVGSRNSSRSVARGRVISEWRSR